MDMDRVQLVRPQRKHLVAASQVRDAEFRLHAEKACHMFCL